MRALVSIVVCALVGCIGCNPPSDAGPAVSGGADQVDGRDGELLLALDWIGEDAVAAQIIHPQRLLKSPLWAKESPNVVLKEMFGYDLSEVRQVVTLIPSTAAEPAVTPMPGVEVERSVPTQIVRFVRPVDGPGWLAKEFKSAKGKSNNRGEYYLIDDSCAGWQVDDRTVIIGKEERLLKLMAAKPKASPLCDRLRSAGLDKDFIFAFVPDTTTRASTKHFLTKPQGLPGDGHIISEKFVSDAASLTDGFTSVVLSIDATREPFVECVADAKDAASARDLNALATKLRPEVLRAFRERQEWFLVRIPQPVRPAAAIHIARVLDSLQFSTRKNQLVATASMPRGLVEDATSALVAARELIPINRLRLIGMATHSHYGTYRDLPPAEAIREVWRSDGKPNLSWRVMLLPFLGHNQLFQQFHLNEPWDSEHNLKLLDRMPEEFMTGNDSQKTSIVAVCGAGAVFDEHGKGGRFPAIQDGTSNTILLVQAGPDKAVPWTKPEDLTFVPGNPLPELGQIGESFLVVMADGRVLRLPTTIPPDKLTALFTATGREQVNVSEFVKK